VTPIEEAKEEFPMPALLHQLGLGDRAKKSARCPLPGHEDENASFGIFKTKTGAWRFKCFSCNSDGDEIEFLRQYEELSSGDAIRRYKELAGANGSKPSLGHAFRKAKAIMSKGADTWADAKTTTRPVRQESPFDWQKRVDAFTAEHQKGLCDWRGFSPDFVSWLHKERLLGVHEGCVAFPVHKGGHIVGCHVRPKNSDKWFHFPKGTNATPLIFGEVQQGDTLQGFESTWDGLAFMDVSGERSGVVITRASSNARFAIEAAAKASIFYLWTQNDAPGAKWQSDIVAGVSCTVKSVKIPAPHKDLNDWTRSGASCKDLLDAMANAEIVREAEKSWMDALDEAVVTSSELHSLKLKQRQKLLGDWFCEGDLGFIFAFRGVGKTWFALATAQSLSTGGKLGDYQAHTPVKVLYIDGEMPPDLMRDRCDGLQGSNGQLEFLNHEILFERSGKVLNITRPEIQEAITQRCVKSKVKVLVLDNLSTLARGMRENEADSWELVNPWLLDLRRRKIAVVIVHHAGRSGEMRGTSKREDNVFWIIALDDAKKNADDKRGARFISRFTKPSRNTQEEVPAYEWHFVTDNATGEVSISHRLAQTMDVFLGLIEDGVTECSEIAEEMKTSKATVSRIAKQAMKSKKIIKVGREYFLAEGAKNDPKA
jgi:AAA domain/CHC2 zinc finger